MRSLSGLRKQAKEIKIIFFDIDDTLRVKEPAYMPESIPLVFEALRGKGIKTGIATGRNFYGLVPEIRKLRPDYYVTINGAYVETGNQDRIYQRPFDSRLVEEIIAWLESEGSAYAFVGSHELRTSQWTSLISSAISPVYGKLSVDPNFYRNQEVYQMLTLSDHDGEIKLPAHLLEKIRRVSWHPNSSDIILREGSKAVGVSKILETLNMTPANLMNFGDELNDLELFDYAGLSVAMKKSHPRILDKADLITDTVENDGIYKALVDLDILE